MKQYLAVPEQRMHHDHHHGKSAPLSHGEEVRDLRFPLVQVAFVLVQVLPVRLPGSDGVEGAVDSALDLS